MSGFLVCWHREGGPIPDVITARAGAYRPTGAVAPPRLLRRDGVAAWHWPGGWAPGAEESLPLARGHWTGSGVLRLDDRAALAARLRDRGYAALGANPRAESGASTLPDDASLAWDSLSTWGEDAPARWNGDYAVAVVSEARDRMIVARGVVGVRSCFHLTLGVLECVSDELGLLVAIAGGPMDPLPEAVGEYLRFGQLVSSTLTFHRGIRRVPSAHTLVVTRDGRTRTWRHWVLPAPPVRHGRSEAEVAEGFREVMGRAVRDRLRADRATLLLSGGLDSAALAVEAADVGAAVRAITVSWEHLLADDEARFAAMTAGSVGMPHDVVALAPTEGFDLAERYDTPEPAPDPEPRVWRAQAARLASVAPVALNGEDMDALLAAPSLFDQLRTEGVRPTVVAWWEYARAAGRLPWVGSRDALSRVSDRGASADLAPDWLRAPFASLGAPSATRSSDHPTRRRAAMAIEQPLWEAVDWLAEPAMSGADVVVLLPCMDPRVIEYCLSVPVVPWLQRKYLLRRAYAGRLPSAVRLRPKTPLTGYYAARVAAWRGVGAPMSLPAPVDEWVALPTWRDALASEDPERVFGAWRVLEFSRWLAQRQAAP